MDGKPLKSAELITLHFSKNDDGEMVDPVTFKVFTDNSHIVALRNTGNVFAYDTVERLNIKAKNWRDLVSEEEFGRKDIITIQDPQNIASRNLATFKYLQEGADTATPEQIRERNDPSRNVNTAALGSTASVLKASKKQEPDINPDALASNRDSIARTLQSLTQAPKSATTVSNSNFKTPSHTTKATLAPNAAQHTTGKAAASFTSTGLTPHTSAERALLSDEDYMLRPKRVKQKGYARISLPPHGDLNLELNPEFAPKAVWNFVTLAKRGYYNGVTFHRNIRNFMLQGGDPTGTGKGGQSCWGKNFEDEFDGPATHDTRGLMSMANKGKNTNGSQFFITYRTCKHLDRKHTIFGRVVGGLDVLSKLENVEVGEGNRPLKELKMKEVVVFVDPFEEFAKERAEKGEKERENEEIRRKGGREDERVTWTGKRVRADGKVDGGEVEGVGKYLKAAQVPTDGGSEEVAQEEWEGGGMEEPVKKKGKLGGGFGNFDSW